MLLIFQNPQFRLLWISQIVNDVSMMTYFTVNGWLALTVTDSPFWVGVTSGIGGLALMTTSIFAGVLADRFDRRKLIIGAQIFQALLNLIVAALIFTEQIQLWQILVLTYLNGSMLAIKVPSRMALTLDVAGRENMLRATAANFAAMTSMGIVIPPLAGLVVDRFDIAWAYIMMFCALNLSALIMVFLRKVVIEKKGEPKTPVQDLKEGVRYVFTTPPVRLLIVLGLTSEFFGWAHETMLPVMARDVLDAGPTGLGYLLSAGSAGGLIATLIISNIRDIKNKGLLLVSGYIGFGLFLILFAMSSWLLLSLVLIAITYSMVALYETTLSTLIQTTVPDEMRGRVVSFQIFTWGFTGLSGFHMGGIATLLGAPVAIALGGSVLVVNGLRLIRSASTRFRETPAGIEAGD